MNLLDDLLAQLLERHRLALLWFAQRMGTVQPWPKPLPTSEGDTLLATRAKGIYKPNWSPYALSVRQTLRSPYKDKDPIYRPDGTWLYPYFQETQDVLAPDREFTNRALRACWRDSVPVGVMRQVSEKPTVRYHVLGLALVAGWEGGYFFLEGFAPSGIARERGPASEVESFVVEEEGEVDKSFDPASIIDARQRVIGQIVRRRGQPEFRKKLLAAYGYQCAISGCDVEEALEAAHIVPYRGPETNEVQNGLLLRGDLHTLFDLGLIAVDESSGCMLAAPKLQGTSYQEIAGQPLRLPHSRALRPNPTALKYHREWAGL